MANRKNPAEGSAKDVGFWAALVLALLAVVAAVPVLLHNLGHPRLEVWATVFIVVAALVVFVLVARSKTLLPKRVTICLALVVLFAVLSCGLYLDYEIRHPAIPKVEVRIHDHTGIGRVKLIPFNTAFLEFPRSAGSSPEARFIVRNTGKADIQKPCIAVRIYGGATLDAVQFPGFGIGSTPNTCDGEGRYVQPDIPPVGSTIWGVERLDSAPSLPEESARKAPVISIGVGGADREVVASLNIPRGAREFTAELQITADNTPRAFYWAHFTVRDE